MQGRRSSTGPFPETLSFGDASTSDDSSINQQICFNNMQNSAHNNTLQDYFTSSNSPNIVYPHFPTQQGHNFDGWTMAGPSSIVPENYNTQNVHVQSSNIALPQDLNMSNNNINDDSDDCQILETQPVPFSTTLDPLWGPSSGSVNLLDSRRKRKSLERNRKKSSKGEGSSSFQQSQIGVWQAVPSGHNAGSSLSSSNQLQNASGISSGEVATESPFAPHLNRNSQNSLSNYQARISPSHQIDPPPLNFPLTRTSPQLPASIPFSPNNLLVQNSRTQTQSSALHAASSRRTQSTSRLTEGSSSRRWYSSSSRQRNELLLGDSITLPRNLPDHHPVFIPTNDLRNSPGSSLGVQLPELNGISHQNPPQYSQRLSELVRRSLLASGNNGGQGNNSAVPPGISSRASNGGHRLLYARSRLLLDRHRDGATGLPHSLRGLASGGEGRGRLVSEIRNVLDLMRRGDNLRPEDIALLDHSMLLGMTSIHDRHRDMRLDTDNMSYEELLALEERIGNVNTGLNEAAILNCLVQRKHFSSAMTTETEVEPCCVCQENYNDGENLGTLECGHEFHSDCIKRWLMLKNLCPICKTTALTI